MPKRDAIEFDPSLTSRKNVLWKKSDVDKQTLLRLLLKNFISKYLSQASLILYRRVVCG